MGQYAGIHGRNLFSLSIINISSISIILSIITLSRVIIIIIIIRSVYPLVE